MFNVRIEEDPSLLFSSNLMNSKIKDINSNKIIGNENCFFFTTKNDIFKDSKYSNNNESINFFPNFDNINTPQDDFINIFDTNLNTEDIINENLDFSILGNIFPPKNKPKILFKAKKKGRPKICKNNNKVHDKHSLDNLLVKIQVHFLSFIIDLSNDVLKSKFGEKTKHNFKHLSHKIKKNVNFNSFYNFKNCVVGDILQMEISEKYKKFNDKKITKETLEKVCKESTWLNNFFNLKYIKLFKDYYYIKFNEPLKEIKYNGATINLSNKTESIYYLLKKNESQKEEILKTIKEVYFNIKTGYFGEDPFASKKEKID